MIKMQDVVKKYRLGGEDIFALNGVSFEVCDGEYLSIIGPSGSGKSTLMNIIGCLDLPDSGNYELAGKKIQNYSPKQLAQIRSRYIGFIFQGFNLLSKLSALENVELPLIYQKIPSSKRKILAEEALESVGLKDRMKHRPQELSGGQQQRVAIARAIVGKPQMILADEPTGNLDSKTGSEIMEMFENLHRSGNTILLITHDASVAARAERSLHIIDGQIISGVSLNQEV